MLEAMTSTASQERKQAHYSDVFARIQSLLEHSRNCDWVAAMASVACELHHGFDYFHWTGFYRVVGPKHLQIGPYQGGHGCLDIPFSRGVCGATARQKQTIIVADVEAFEGHIACAATTKSEIVVPVLTPEGQLLAVLDVDSDLPSAFGRVDQEGLENICNWLGKRFADTKLLVVD